MTLRSRLYFLLPAIGFVILAGTFVWGLQPDRDPQMIPSAMISKEIPEFDLAAVEGLDMPGLASADLRQGDVVLVNFFASWCVPCQAEHPHLTALAESEDIPLYGINHKDKAENATAWLARLGNPYSKIGADSGRALIDWGVYGVPETFIVDGEGKIRYHYRGPLFPKVIDEEIKPMLESLRS